MYRNHLLKVVLIVGLGVVTDGPVCPNPNDGFDCVPVPKEVFCVPNVVDAAGCVPKDAFCDPNCIGG